MNFFFLVTVMLLVYIVFNTFMISKQRQSGNSITDLLDHFNEEEVFFTKANEILENEKNAGTKEKVRVLKLWGEAYYKKDEDFKRTLEELDLTHFFNTTKNPIEAYEDAFFYLCMAIPNRLYSDGNMELLDLLSKKVEEYKGTLDNQLVYKIGKENEKFYYKVEDKGKEFLEGILEGEYAGYFYSKQLIGVYKNVVSTILAAIYQEENNTEKLKEQYQYLEVFKDSALGKRMLEELHITLPSDTEEKEESEE